MSEEEREIWQLDCQKKRRRSARADDASERKAHYAGASMIRSPTATAAIEKASISQAQHARNTVVGSTFRSTKESVDALPQRTRSRNK
jgi:hypothetical protein